MLFYFEEETFEVLAFRVMDADGVVHGVGELADDADAAVGVHGGGEDHSLKILLADSLATREGHQEAPCGQRLHGTLVDGTVALKSLLERAVVLGEGGRVEDDEIKLSV